MDTVAYNFKNMERVNQSSYPKRVYALMIILMMAGNVYLFPFYRSLDMGEILLFICLPYFLAKLSQKTVQRQDGIIFLFLWYAIIISFAMNSVLGGSLMSPIIRLSRDFFYYFIIFFLGIHFFDFKIFKKMLVTFCLILSAFVILQVVVYALSGYFIPGFLMNTYVNDGGYTGAELYANHLRYARIAGYLKPNGFLCEPAHSAQCFFVAIIALLFDEKKEVNDTRKAIFISLATVLTMSTSALLYLIFAWVLWSFKEGKKNILKIFMLVFSFFGIGAYAISQGYLSSLSHVFQRFTRTLSGDYITNSSQLRMMKGFLTFDAMPVWGKIFGIGFGNYSAAVYSIFSQSDINMIESEYMNTISYLLVSTGIIGSLILISFFVKVYRRSGTLSRVMILGMILMASGSSIYSSPIWVWLMLCILYAKREESETKWQMRLS